MWSRKYNKCILCETTKRKHVARGMCRRCYSKKRKEEDPEKVKKYDRKWKKENPEKIKKWGRKWYKNNSEKVKKYGKKYRKENPEKVKKNFKKWYKKQDPDEQRRKCAKRIKKWRKDHPEEARCLSKISSKKWRKNNKLKCNISNLINQKLKKRLSSKKGNSTLSFLPYTINELIQHLEKQFEPGMTWENHSVYGWHIDHKIPDCKFNYKNVNDKEFQECWALENLQPLWWQDNLKKGCK
jgi:hypothetical protein